MADFTYYCEVTLDRADIRPGTYSFTTDGPRSLLRFNRLTTVSDKVWRQGPRGGVKIIKERTTGIYQYVTKDEEEMKKFMWAKLQARVFK